MLRLLSKTIYLLCLVLSLAIGCLAEGNGQERANPDKTLADRIAEFRARGPATALNAPAAELPSSIVTRRTYVGSDGEVVEVFLNRTQNDSSAYSLLTLVKENQGHAVKIGQIGTASIEQPGEISFVK